MSTPHYSLFQSDWKEDTRSRGFCPIETNRNMKRDESFCTNGLSKHLLEFPSASAYEDTIWPYNIWNTPKYFCKKRYLLLDGVTMVILFAASILHLLEQDRVFYQLNNI